MSSNWRVSATVQTCPHCLAPYRFIVFDDMGRYYGCRESHGAAMELARKKALHYANLSKS